MLTQKEISRGFYALPRLRFLTVKGPDKWQRIGKVNDALRHRASHYFIVREKNKKTDGYHFHAIYSLKEEGKEIIPKKGIHFHVKNITGKMPYGLLTARSIRDIDEEFYHYNEMDEVKAEAIRNEAIEDRAIIADIVRTGVKIAKDKKRASVDRVIAYMHKEMPQFPGRYVDYILV